MFGLKHKNMSNFHPLEVVSRSSVEIRQIEAGENLNSSKVENWDQLNSHRTVYIPSKRKTFV